MNATMVASGTIAATGTACPTFMPGLVYTLDDVKFLRECGIDPEVGNIEDHLRTLKEDQT